MERTTVTCKYCGREISRSNISKHINSHENGNYEKQAACYHLDHDDLLCKFCKTEFRDKNALAQHEIRCRLNPNRIALVIDNFNNFGRQAWNKGLSVSTDERVKKYVETHKENVKNGSYHFLYGQDNPSSRQEVRDKISETCRKKAQNGDWHFSINKLHCYKYNGNTLHCKWEVYYAVYLDANKINWIRNEESFPYWYQGKLHHYTPDFYLIDSNEYIEIKGFARDSDYAKWRDFPKDKILKVLFEEDLNAIGAFNYDISEYIR